MTSFKLGGIAFSNTPAPSVGDVWCYDGVQYTPCAPGGGPAQILYVTSASSDIGGYDVWDTSPQGGQFTLTNTIPATTTKTLIEAFATASGYPNITVIPAGKWEQDSYVQVSSGSNTTTLNVDVYNRTSGGVETLLFSFPNVTISGNGTGIQAIHSEAIESSFAIAASDRLVVKYNMTKTGGGSITGTLYGGGVANYSHIHTPIGTATGSGVVSGQANGVIPLATGATTIGAQSHLSDNGTTVTSSEPFVVTPDGVHPNSIGFMGNTTIPTLPANTVNHIGPPAATFTAYGLQDPSTGPSAANSIEVFPAESGSPLNSLGVFTAGVGTGSPVFNNGPNILPQLQNCSAACSPVNAYFENTIFNNYGQGAVDVQITGPVVFGGMNFIMVVGTAQPSNYWRYTSTTNNIYLDNNPTPVTNIIFAAPAVGNAFACFSFKSGATTYSLKCTTLAGTSTSS